MRVGWKPKFQDPRVASVRFRCLTPLAYLRDEGFPIELYDDQRRDGYAAVIFSKLYGRADQELARRLRRQGARVILDLSDNHFYNPEALPAYVAAARDLAVMAELADQVICCSAYLADVVAAHAKLAAPPVVVGDAVEDFSSPPPESRDERFRILWFGSHAAPNAPAGMADLLRVRAQLAAASARGAHLAVISNNAAAFERLREQLPISASYREWDHEGFALELSRADLVIVPVTRNPFTLSKSNNRVATALWHGVPVLADSIPTYAELGEFAVLDDWERGMPRALDRDPALHKRTDAGKRFVRTRFTTQAIAREWRSAIEGVLSRDLVDGRLP